MTASMELIIAAAISVTLILSFLLFKRPSSGTYWNRLEIPELPRNSFFRNLCGYLLTPSKSKAETCLDLYQKLESHPYGGFYDFNGRPILMIRHPKLIKSVLSEHYLEFYDRDKDLVSDRDILSYHLINLTGEHWRMLRKILQPAFARTKIVDQLLNLINIVDDFVDRNLLVKTTDCELLLNLNDLFTRFSVIVIGRCIFRISPDDELLTDLQKIAKLLFRVNGRKKMFHFVNNFYRNSLLRSFSLTPKRFDDDVTEFFLRLSDRVIADRIQQEDGHPPSAVADKYDFLDSLLAVHEVEQKFQGRNIRQVIAAQLFLFLNAGFEAIANSLIFTIYELSRNESVQDAVRIEVDNLWPDNDVLTMDILNEMKYLKQIINETLRLYPAVPKLKRQCTRDCVLTFNDVPITVKKGTEMFIPVYGLQRDPTYYPEPNQFNPDHFSDGRLPEAYFPFGYGRKICIGMNFAVLALRIMLATLIRKYTFKQSTATVTKIRYDPYSVSIRSLDDIWVRYRPLRK